MHKYVHYIERPYQILFIDTIWLNDLHNEMLSWAMS